MLVHSPKDLAVYYRDRRKIRGISQTDVAQEAVLRQDTVSKFENKPDNARLETLFRLLAALELEMHLVPKGESASESDSEGWNEPW